MEALTHEKLTELGFYGEQREYLWNQLHWYLTLIQESHRPYGLTIDVAYKIANHKILTKSSRFAKKNFRALCSAIDKYTKKINRQKRADTNAIFKKLGGLKKIDFDTQEGEPKHRLLLTYERFNETTGGYVLCEHAKKQYDILTPVHERIGEPIFSEDLKYKFVYYGIKKDQPCY